MNWDQLLLQMTAALGVITVIALVIAVLEIIAFWRVLKKAGEAGWKSIIPFLNGHVLFRIAWKPAYYWLTLVLLIAATVFNTLVSQFAVTGAAATVISVIQLLCSVAALVIVCIFNRKLAACFGKGAGFTVGLVLFNTLFMMILAFGSTQYQGKRGV